MRSSLTKPTDETLALEARVSAASAALAAFPKVGPLNLTPDEVKFSPEYKAAKEAFNKAFAALRDHNASRRRCES